MTLDACVAHAINKNLDIVQAFPEVQDMSPDEIEPAVEKYVSDLLGEWVTTLQQDEALIENPAYLLAEIIKDRTTIEIPLKMRISMCETIKSLRDIDARFILDTDNGASLYYVKLNIQL